MLDDIVMNKQAELAALPMEPFSAAERWGRFRSALVAPELSIIAEIKRRSPSAGHLGSVVDPAERALAYQQGGAAAISVLTDQRYFGGSFDDLERVARAVALPVLCKDFIVDARQVYEAARRGASACLLIVAALSQDDLNRLTLCVRQCGLDVLVEVHDEEELARAVDAGAEILGINNRNLKTMEVDLTTVDRLAPLAPANVVLVAESGYESEVQVAALPSRVQAVLIGSALVKSEHPAVTLGQLRKARTADR